MSEPPLMTGRELAVAVNGVELFSQLEFELSPGQVLPVTGASGSGKTTLLRAVAGLLDLTAGELRLRGNSPDALGWPAWRRRVLFTAQRPVLYDETVRQNLERPFRVRAAGGRPFPEARARELLAQLALPTDCLDRQALTLSEGQQQRLCFVRALLVEPEVLLLDEPTSALDPAVASELEGLLRDELGRRGAAALVVTHDPEQAARLGPRIIVIGTPEAANPAAAPRSAARRRHA